MKTKIKFLIKQSLEKKIKTKWFKVVNILLCLLLIVIVNIDTVINAFGGDFKEEKEILVVDEVGVFDNFSKYFNELKSSVEDMANYEVKLADESIENIKETLDQDNDNILVVINKDDVKYMTATVYSYDQIDMIVNQLLNSALTSVKGEYALNMSNINQNDLINITSPIELNSVVLNEDVENSEAKDLVGASLITVFLVPFFILIVILVQMIGAEINDEKTTRGMEIIISNVSPEAHLFSKIIATTLFSLLQLGLMLLYGGISLGIRYVINGGLGFSSTGIGLEINDFLDLLKSSGFLNLLWQGLPAFIILFVFSFLIYALLAAVLASMTTSIEDYQQLQTPLMLVLMAGYYLGIMASVFDGALFIKIISYIPFLSVLIAPTLFLLGQTTLIDLFISCILLIGTCYLLFKYGIRVYRVGILNYASKDLWKKVFKSLKRKEG